MKKPKIKDMNKWTMIRIKEGTKIKLKKAKEDFAELNTFDAYINYLMENLNNKLHKLR